MVAGQTLDEKLETSPLIYVKESKRVDDKDVKVFDFVHDTYRDFFLAKYFADEINSGRFSIKQDYVKQWCDFTSYGYPCVKGAVKKAIIFMVDMLNEDNLADILDVCSRVYPRLMEHYVKMNDGFYDPWSIQEIEFAFEVAKASNFPTEKLPQEMKKWIKYSSENCSFFFYGHHFKEDFGFRTALFSEEAQNYIFHALPKEKKQNLINWCLEQHTFSYSNLLFGTEENAIIIDYLSNRPDIRLNYSTFYYNLLKYLEKNDSTVQLWIDFLKSGKPNYDYAAYVLGKFEDSRAVKPLIDALVSQTKYIAIPDYEENISPFLRALIRIGEPALPLLEETLLLRRDFRKDMLYAIIDIRINGSQEADDVLRRNVTAAEYETLCLKYEDLMLPVEICKEERKQYLGWLREIGENIEKYF